MATLTVTASAMHMHDEKERGTWTFRSWLGTGPRWGENKMSLGDKCAAKGSLSDLGSAPTSVCGQPTATEELDQQGADLGQLLACRPVLSWLLSLALSSLGGRIQSRRKWGACPQPCKIAFPTPDVLLQCLAQPG